ncbi:N-acetyl-gamma-glutamyl-phosphate reductase [Dankookia rubra]|uniref:N-acetyl-gamma-glutamyl-phosphate reductase n=1 Tax=Dankookia rubra TaxID=1442381 RepID=A0A4R5QLA6_9PROT|nr:N-acetyl-gamma-glutamyl-phosphate reductase [Dankookia rubra]TDH64290.1 N-acetyl-gamma-glutamyl-phosphate reductase [Dankookia rubra]
MAKGSIPTVFIDGEAGTTGLQIRERLELLPHVAVRSIAPERRKDPGARREMMASVDLVVLCLPDEAAKESAALAASLGAEAPKVLDASTAFRVNPDWAYGLPELSPEQPAKIAASMRVSNPGCYPTGAILLLRPLIQAGLLPADYPVTVNAVSGYSGGGNAMIAAYESRTAPEFELYGLGLEHKHVAEMHYYTGLTRRPIFVPSVGDFRQGMIDSIPLHLDLLTGGPAPADLESVLTARYAGSAYVRVVKAEAKLEPEAMNNTNQLELRVHGNAARGQAVLTARYDNLGKGASGAAVQNLGLMLGIAVETRLPAAAE